MPPNWVNLCRWGSCAPPDRPSATDPSSSSTGSDTRSSKSPEAGRRGCPQRGSRHDVPHPTVEPSTAVQLGSEVGHDHRRPSQPDQGIDSAGRLLFRLYPGSILQTRPDNARRDAGRPESHRVNPRLYSRSEASQPCALDQAGGVCGGPSDGLVRGGCGLVRGVGRRVGRGVGRWCCASAGGVRVAGQDGVVGGSGGWPW